jgi:hypothetical protein
VVFASKALVLLAGHQPHEYVCTVFVPPTRPTGISGILHCCPIFIFDTILFEPSLHRDLGFDGSFNGRSTVIGAWSEMRSATEAFNSRIVTGKCGANW